MEENENKPEEAAEEGSAPAEEPCENTEEKAALSREQILEMSREENKNGDEMKKDVYKSASSLAFRVGIWIAIVFSVISMIVNKQELLFPMYSLVGGMMAADFIYIGKKENKKGLIAGGIVEAVCVALLIVLSILGMCGVIAIF